MAINPKALKENFLKPSFKVEFEEKPNLAIENLIKDSTDHPLNTDKWVYRIVVGVLGASLLIMVIFLSCLLPTYKGEKLPDVFISTISAIVGAIAGLLAPTPVKTENNNQ